MARRKSIEGISEILERQPDIHIPVVRPQLTELRSDGKIDPDEEAMEGGCFGMFEPAPDYMVVWTRKMKRGRMETAQDHEWAVNDFRDALRLHCEMLHKQWNTPATSSIRFLGMHARLQNDFHLGAKSKELPPRVQYGLSWGIYGDIRDTSNAGPRRKWVLAYKQGGAYAKAIDALYSPWGFEGETETPDLLGVRHYRLYGSVGVTRYTARATEGRDRVAADVRKRHGPGGKRASRRRR